jgi:hypothetical protein
MPLIELPFARLMRKPSRTPRAIRRAILSAVWLSSGHGSAMPKKTPLVALPLARYSRKLLPTPTTTRPRKPRGLLEGRNFSSDIKNPREALTFRAAFSREPSSTSTTTARLSLSAVSFRQGTASPVPKTTQHERLQPLRSAFFLF